MIKKTWIKIALEVSRIFALIMLGVALRALIDMKYSNQQPLSNEPKIENVSKKQSDKEMNDLTDYKPISTIINQRYDINDLYIVTKTNEIEDVIKQTLKAKSITATLFTQVEPTEEHKIHLLSTISYPIESEKYENWSSFFKDVKNYVGQTLYYHTDTREKPFDFKTQFEGDPILGEKNITVNIKVIQNQDPTNLSQDFSKNNTKNYIATITQKTDGQIVITTLDEKPEDD